MDSLWNEVDVGRFPGTLGARVYTSRLLGRDPCLVLHGGGNTSVKVGDLLYVKASGSDLATVDETSFIPLRRECVSDVLARETLDNAGAMRALDGCLARRPAPRPSIETLLHAALPATYVEHAHADAVLAVVNTERGEQLATDLYGDLAPLVPYHHSGVELARGCREVLDRWATPRTVGLILQFHGIVAFGATARDSYENMIRLVTIAEAYLRSKNAWTFSIAHDASEPLDCKLAAALRAAVSRAAGFPLVMRIERDPFFVSFARRRDVHILSQQGPATPQHAVYTKRLPQLGRDVVAFSRNYSQYLQHALGEASMQLDPAPRIVLDPSLGLCALGVTAEHARIAAECYRHDAEIMLRACAHDTYCCAPEQAIARAELEYGGGERKLRERAARDQPLLGQVALVAPGAHRVQPALPEHLRAQGAAVAVVGSASGSTAGSAALCVLPDGHDAALDQLACAYGGLDRVYAEPGDERWAALVQPLLELSPIGGRKLRAARPFPDPGPTRT